MKHKVKAGKRKNGYALVFDLVIIAIGIVVAIILSKYGIIDTIVNALSGYTILASFIAGIFFTSTFTIAPSSIAIIHIASHTPLLPLAFWGALGAMCGDLILFFFIRDRFSADLMGVFSSSTRKHFLHSFHFGFFKWLSPILGALIIASPLPDEIGISLLGMSKVKLSILLPITFVMNFIGIYLIIAFANLIS